MSMVGQARLAQCSSLSRPGLKGNVKHHHTGTTSGKTWATSEAVAMIAVAAAA